MKNYLLSNFGAMVGEIGIFPYTGLKPTWS